MTDRTCGGHTAGHDGMDPRLMALLVNGHWQRSAVLCRGCRSVLSVMFDVIPERRSADRPVAFPRLRLRRAAA